VNPLNRQWIVAGNLVSSFVLLVIPEVAMIVDKVKPYWSWRLHAYDNSVYWGSVAASLALFAGGFIVQTRNKTPNSEVGPIETEVTTEGNLR
jgi:hypothetical protein